MPRIEKKDAVFFLIALALFAGGVLAVRDTPPRADETVHYPRMLQVFNPGIKLPIEGAMLPGYHLTMAAISAVTHNTSGQGARLFTAVLSFLSVAAFFILAKKIDPGPALGKSMQFLILPVLFPLFFFLYTDAYSLAWILFMVWAALCRRMFLGGIFCLAAVLVRQNNILWGFFACLLYYAQNVYPRRDVASLGRLARDCWVFILAAVLFAVYWIWHQSPIHTEQFMNPIFVNPGNIAFCLFLFFFLFLPLNLANAPRIAALLRKDKRPLAAVALFFALYLWKFQPDHYYNNPRVLAYFLHNVLLGFMTSSGAVKAACFLPMGYAVLSLWVTPLARRSFYLLYPVAFLFLLPIYMVEPRYDLIPFSLFIAFKGKDHPVVQVATLGLFAAMTAFLFLGTAQSRFFL